MKCSVCGRSFGGLSAFDLHRTGEVPDDAPVGTSRQYRRCLSTTEMRDIGLKRDRYGRWCRLTPIMAATGDEQDESEAA